MRFDDRLAFGSILPVPELTTKPRTVGLTEVRNAALGMNALSDLVEMFGGHIDAMKWTAASARLVVKDIVKAHNAYLLDHDIEVSTGGMTENVLLQGEQAVSRFLDEAHELGFTIIEVATGVVTMSRTQKMNLVRDVRARGFKAKPEVGSAAEPGASNKRNQDRIIGEVQACLEAGAYKVMIEEEGIFQYVESWDTALVERLLRDVDPANLMFEASDIEVMLWLIRTIGPDVNLFVDPSHIAWSALFRAGLSGSPATWERVVTYSPKQPG